MAKKAQYSVVDSKESFEALLTRVRQAQQSCPAIPRNGWTPFSRPLPWRPTRPHPSGQGGCGGDRHGGRRGQGHQEPLRLRIYL